MSVAKQKETLSFQTEIKQLMNLMVNALYSNKEITIREVVSNSSDAIDKLRFQALSDKALYENDPELKIKMRFDKTARTLTIEDNGIGMSREEVISHLGTIAKSGTKEFLAQLTGDQRKDSALIGQFGVGFYSAFIIARKVVVLTRRAGLTSEHGVRFESEGEGDYSIENIERGTRGTEVILYLKEGEDDFLNDYKLKSIIKKYSDHITVPIELLVEKTEKKDDKEETTATWEQINKATALWTLPKNQISEEDYNAFYKHISHDFENPLLTIHHRVEGRFEYYSLLYLPAKAPFDLWNREQPRGLKLYVKRVFIMDDAEQLLPLYLRFVRGVIDSSDLPLNISREILQNNKIIETIKSSTAKKVLTTLEKLAEDDAEKYQNFWDAFGQVIKEGPGEDFANKETIAKLLRFSTTQQDSEKQTVSLAEYVSRMKEDQEFIYYVTAENFLAAKHSPHLEIFRKNGIEVLLLGDRVDEWLVAHLNEYDTKKLQSVAQGDLDLGKMISEEEKEQQKKEEDDFASVVKQVKEALADKVKEVRITHRLTSSPACIVSDENEMGLQMQRIMKAVGQAVPVAKPILEINPQHRIIQHLKNETDDARFSEWSHILLDQSILAEGGQLEDAANYVHRLNNLLLSII